MDLQPPLFLVTQSLREECTAERLFVSYPGLTGAVNVGSAVLLDDGLVSVRVTDVRQDSVTGLIENSGAIKSRRGVNLPGAKVDLPALSDKDKIDIRQVFSCGHRSYPDLMLYGCLRVRWWAGDMLKIYTGADP